MLVFFIGGHYSGIMPGEIEKAYQPDVSISRQEQPTYQEQPDFTPKADIVSGMASVAGAFGGLFGGASGGDEPKDTASQKRKKKKKKRTRHID